MESGKDKSAKRKPVKKRRKPLNIIASGTEAMIYSFWHIVPEQIVFLGNRRQGGLEGCLSNRTAIEKLKI